MLVVISVKCITITNHSIVALPRPHRKCSAADQQTPTRPLGGWRPDSLTPTLGAHGENGLQLLSDVLLVTDLHQLRSVLWRMRGEFRS